MLARRLAGADVTVTGSGVNGEVSYGWCNASIR